MVWWKLPRNPAVTATLYATSQLYPTLSRDQVVARFIECLTYPEGVGTVGEDGWQLDAHSEDELSLWGLGIPDLACIATPLGETMMQASAGKEVTVKGSPLPGVTVTTVERRYGVPFALGSLAERFEMRSLGSTPGTLLQGGDTVPVVAGAWGISPLVTIEDNRVTGGGVRIEREGLGLGVHYRTPETYFGARKGTGSFDPGILHESTLAAAFTTNLSASVFTAAFTTVWTKAEGTELVDLEGFGYRGDVELHFPKGNFLYTLGAAYGEVHTQYRVGRESYDVPVHSTLSATAAIAYTTEVVNVRTRVQHREYNERSETSFGMDVSFDF